MKSLFFLTILVFSQAVNLSLNLNFNRASAETIVLPNLKTNDQTSDKTNDSTSGLEIDIRKYIDFVIQWSSYTYAGEPLPKVKFEKAGLVEVYAYGEQVVAQAEQNKKKLSKVLAIYDRRNKTIYVSDDVNANDPTLEITLVHETVHYLQDINGYTESLGEYIVCTESEAYDIQVLWQIEFNVDKKSVPFAQERSLLSAMRCMGSKFK